MPGRTFVLASANVDKAAEIVAILAAVPDLTLLPRPADVPDVEETGETLEDNARLKARALCEATGRSAVADDTGLEVEALDGAPGVYSARFAGEGATLRRQRGQAPHRTGAGRCALGRTGGGPGSAAWPSSPIPTGRELWVEGEVTGVITPEPRGSGGFGYDPVFAPDGFDGRTFAQMTPEEKHAVSHRGRAFRALAERLTGGA